MGSIVDDIHKRQESVTVCSATGEKGEDEREGKDDEEVEEQDEAEGNGQIDVGNADASHGLSGIDVITTFGT